MAVEDIQAVAAAIAERLAGIAGLRTRDTLGDSANPPEAHVFLVAPVEFDVTMNRGTDKFTFRIRLFASRAGGSERAQEVLAPYMAGAGAKSVKAAVEGGTPRNTLLGQTIGCRVTGVPDFGTVTAGGVDYIGCDFVVETWG